MFVSLKICSLTHLAIYSSIYLLMLAQWHSQSTNQSADQSINPSINHWCSQSTNQPINQLINQSQPLRQRLVYRHAIWQIGTLAALFPNSPSIPLLPADPPDNWGLIAGIHLVHGEQNTGIQIQPSTLVLIHACTQLAGLTWTSGRTSVQHRLL